MATKFELNHLIRTCVDALKDKVTSANVLCLFQQAMNLYIKELQQTCLLHICKDARILLDSDQFTALTVDCVFEILEMDSLQIYSEVQAFESMLRWGIAACNGEGLDPSALTINSRKTNLQTKLKKLIPLIRFPLMEQIDFEGKVAPTRILTEEQESDLRIVFQTPLEKRGHFHRMEFNTKPREYFQPQVNSVSRFDPNREPLYFPQCENSLPLPRWESNYTLKSEKDERLRVEVDRRVNVLGLKFHYRTFCTPIPSGNGPIDWQLFTAKVIINELVDNEEQKLLLTHELKPFIVQDVNESEILLQRPITFENGRKYSIHILFSGRLIKDKRVYDEDDYALYWDKRLVLLAQAKHQGDLVTFSFTREPTDTVPVNEGLISGLLFSNCHCAPEDHCHCRTALTQHRSTPLVNLCQLIRTVPSLVKVYFDITADGVALGRMTFELWNDTHPKTSEFFRTLCTGEKGVGYKDFLITHSSLQMDIFCGHFNHSHCCGQGKGINLPAHLSKYLEREERDVFEGEIPPSRTYPPGLLRMGEKSAFSILVTPYDKKSHGEHTFFGWVVQGLDIVKTIQSFRRTPGFTGGLVKKILIAEAGQL